MSLASQSALEIRGVSCLLVPLTPSDSAKIFEFCVATALLNGLMDDDSGRSDRRQPWSECAAYCQPLLRHTEIFRCLLAVRICCGGFLYNYPSQVSYTETVRITALHRGNIRKLSA